MTESGPLADAGFATFAKDLVLFCHPESEAKAAKHQGLAKRKGVTGLPGIAFLDAAGEVIVQVPPAVHSLARFEHYAQRARQFLQLRAAAAAGDPRAAAALLIAQVEERQLDHAAATRRRGQLAGETAAERARLDELLLDLRLSTAITAAGSDTAARRELGRQYLALLATDSRPSPAVSRGFWFVILEHCEAAGDVEGFAVGLAGLRRNVELTSGGAEWGTRLLAEHEAKLARLRARK